tara:strand:+ start:2725 stop:3033 length:309 start_codon:yes stop_codon:yes gene_type:complete
MGLSPKPGGKGLRAGLNPTGKPNLGGGGGLKRSNPPKIPSNPNLGGGVGIDTGLVGIPNSGKGIGRIIESSGCGVDAIGCSGKFTPLSLNLPKKLLAKSLSD